LRDKLVKLIHFICTVQHNISIAKQSGLHSIAYYIKSNTH